MYYVSDLALRNYLWLLWSWLDVVLLTWTTKQRKLVMTMTQVVEKQVMRYQEKTLKLDIQKPDG